MPPLCFCPKRKRRAGFVKETVHLSSCTAKPYVLNTTETNILPPHLLSYFLISNVHLIYVRIISVWKETVKAAQELKVTP